jgi:hypothetical protein
MPFPKPENQHVLHQTIATLVQCLTTLDELEHDIAAALLSHCIERLRADIINGNSNN